MCRYDREVAWTHNASWHELSEKKERRQMVVLTMDKWITGPTLEPPLPRRKKCPELAYRTHGFITTADGGGGIDAVDSNVVADKVQVCEYNVHITHLACGKWSHKFSFINKRHDRDSFVRFIFVTGRKLQWHRHCHRINLARRYLVSAPNTDCNSPGLKEAN